MNIAVTKHFLLWELQMAHYSTNFLRNCGMVSVLAGCMLSAAFAEPSPDARGRATPDKVNGDSTGSVSSQDSIAELQQSVTTLQHDLEALRNAVSRQRVARSPGGAAVQSQATALLSGNHPNPVPTSLEGLPARKMADPPSLARRRQETRSSSTFKRPRGEIAGEPRKMSKGEMVDAHYRTSGGSAAMTEVVNALKRLDEDIRYSQKDDQLQVRATRAGQEVVRHLIEYYEDELTASE